MIRKLLSKIHQCGSTLRPRDLPGDRPASHFRRRRRTRRVGFGAQPRLAHIEERLDLRLINRTTRSVALTEAGERLFSRISPAFQDIDDALEELNNFRGKPAGMLRFNAARQSAQLVLLPIVTRFLEAFPDVSVEIAINDALVDTVSAGFDAGVRFGETSRPT